MLEHLLEPATAGVGLIWVEALATDLDNQTRLGRWTEAWDSLFLRANEKRDSLRRHLRGGLVFAAPPSVKPRIRTAAPDLWSVRGIVLELAQSSPSSGEVSITALPPIERSRDQPEMPWDPEFELSEADRRLRRGGENVRPAAQSLLRAVDGFLAVGRASDAVEAATKALDLLNRAPAAGEPDEAAALAALSRAEDEAGDSIAALQHIKQAIALRGVEPSKELVLWHYGAGRLARKTADLAAAREFLTDGLRLAEQLPDRIDSGQRVMVSMLNDKLGDVCVDQGELRRASNAYEEANEIDRALAASPGAGPQMQRNLAIGLSKLGDVRRAQGDLQGALLVYQDARTIRERLADADPANANDQRNISVTWNNIGNIRRDQGDRQGALEAYENARAIADRLAATDPLNAMWQRDLLVSFMKIGAARQGDLQGALRAYEDAHAISERLVARDPTNPEWQRDLSVTWDGIGDIRFAQGNFQGALRAYERGLAIAQRLATADAANANWQRDLSLSWRKIGVVRRAQGDTSEALRAFERALTISQRISSLDPTNVTFQSDKDRLSSEIDQIREATDDIARQ